MTVLCVDGEVSPLNSLKQTLMQCPDVTKAFFFTDGNDALTWAKEHTFDVALVEICLHNRNGIELALKLRQINPDTAVIFCSQDSCHAVDVVNLHIDSGYLLKPITAEALQREIDHIKLVRLSGEYLLTVCCYGGFEVFDKKGVPLRFKRKRAKELLALLIDREGNSMTAKEICAVMFPDDGVKDQKNMNYFYKLYYELIRVLTEAGAESVIKKNGNGYYADMSLIHLDHVNRDIKPYLKEYIWT